MNRSFPSSLSSKVSALAVMVTILVAFVISGCLDLEPIEGETFKILLTLRTTGPGFVWFPMVVDDNNVTAVLLGNYTVKFGIGFLTAIRLDGIDYLNISHEDVDLEIEVTRTFWDRNEARYHFGGWQMGNDAIQVPFYVSSNSTERLGGTVISSYRSDFGSGGGIEYFNSEDLQVGWNQLVMRNTEWFADEEPPR